MGNSSVYSPECTQTGGHAEQCLFANLDASSGTDDQGFIDCLWMSFAKLHNGPITQLEYIAVHYARDYYCGYCVTDIKDVSDCLVRNFDIVRRTFSSDQSFREFLFGCTASPRAILLNPDRQHELKKLLSEFVVSGGVGPTKIEVDLKIHLLGWCQDTCPGGTHGDVSSTFFDSSRGMMCEGCGLRVDLTR